MSRSSQDGTFARTPPTGPRNKKETWTRHPAELDFLCPTSIEDTEIIDYLRDHVFSVPPRAHSTSPSAYDERGESSAFFGVVCQINGQRVEVQLPVQYRTPVLWVVEFLWTMIRSSLTAESPEATWPAVRYEIWHVARLCQSLLEQAHRARDLTSRWRSLSFDRALRRYSLGYFRSANEDMKQFERVFSEQDYHKDDILAFDWTSREFEKRSNIRLSADQLSGGVSAEELQARLQIDPGPRAFRWASPGNSYPAMKGSPSSTPKISRRGSRYEDASASPAVSNRTPPANLGLSPLAPPVPAEMVAQPVMDLSHHSFMPPPIQRPVTTRLCSASNGERTTDPRKRLSGCISLPPTAPSSPVASTSRLAVHSGAAPPIPPECPPHSAFVCAPERAGFAVPRTPTPSRGDFWIELMGPLRASASEMIKAEDMDDDRMAVDPQPVLGHIDQPLITPRQTPDRVHAGSFYPSPSPDHPRHPQRSMQREPEFDLQLTPTTPFMGTDMAAFVNILESMGKEMAALQSRVAFLELQVAEQPASPTLKSFHQLRHLLDKMEED
ncbi:unnamed protein product [Mycena citricolor]|uniref:Uncharacterized protein n=1 Tax=Mycena citricolor TaxID=2018698 RepID=A0AAD2JVA5_9AGAR|nr:unnamed protein product [Mycena citricolor]